MSPAYVSETLFEYWQTKVRHAYIEYHAEIG
jgi:hypothetical protein